MAMRVLLIAVLAVALLAAATSAADVPLAAAKAGAEAQDKLLLKLAGEDGALAVVALQQLDAERLAAEGEMLDQVIEELIAAGELSAEGAEKLRAALAEAKHNLVSAEVDAVLLKELGDAQLDGAHELTIVTPEEETRQVIIKRLSDAEGLASEERKLEISIEDGEVRIDGEGFSEEELAKIKQEVEAQHGHGVIVVPELGEELAVPEGDMLFRWDDGEGHEYFHHGPFGWHEFLGGDQHKAVIEELNQLRAELDGVATAEQLERLSEAIEQLKQAQALVAPESFDGFKWHEELLPHLESLDELKELQDGELFRLYEFKGVPGSEEWEQYLRELPELEGLKDFELDLGEGWEQGLEETLESFEQQLYEYLKQFEHTVDETVKSV